MADATRQWKRKAQVIIGKAGSGLLVENLRIEFEVIKTVDSAPNTATIKIYNLNPTNESRVKSEYNEVLLNCGYEGAMRLVFRGNIKYVYRYRENNDYITEIEAADGDKDFRTAVMNETLAAGTTNAQIIDRAAGTFSGGTKKGYVGVQSKPRLRGRVVSGNTRDILSEIARDSGANWSIQDGQLTIVGANDLAPGEAIVIRGDTGLLGAPEINDKGVTVKCLLNPQIAINGAINLDNTGFKSARTKQGESTEKTKDRITDPARKSSDGNIRPSPDGIYKAVKITHKGDTRGTDWYTETVCIDIGAKVTKK